MKKFKPEDYLEAIKKQWNGNWIIHPFYVGGSDDYAINEAKKVLKQWFDESPKKDGVLDYFSFCNHGGGDPYEYKTYFDRWRDMCIGWTAEELGMAEWVLLAVPYCRREVWCIKLPEPRVLPEAKTFKEYLIGVLSKDVEDLKQEVQHKEDLLAKIHETNEDEVMNEYEDIDELNEFDY